METCLQAIFNHVPCMFVFQSHLIIRRYPAFSAAIEMCGARQGGGGKNHQSTSRHMDFYCEKKSMFCYHIFIACYVYLRKMSATVLYIRKWIILFKIHTGGKNVRQQNQKLLQYHNQNNHECQPQKNVASSRQLDEEQIMWVPASILLDIITFLIKDFSRSQEPCFQQANILFFLFFPPLTFFL